MLIGYKTNDIETYALWSGVADPIGQLINDGKNVILFVTARRVSRELNELAKNGLVIFDIQKIKEFICWTKEMECKRGSASGIPKL
ncbi:MAG: hypothetical protein WCX69_00100 [Candidatus Paceibacterota bacterium]